jgi:hypothetical protein
VIVVVAAIPMVLLSKLFGGGVGDWHQLLPLNGSINKHFKTFIYVP